MTKSYHVNSHFSHGLPLLGCEGLENITFWVLNELESNSQVVILQHGFVVVHQCQLRTCMNQRIVLLRELSVSTVDKVLITCIDEVLVGDSRVVNVVNSGGEESGKDFQGRKNSLRERWGNHANLPQILQKKNNETHVQRRRVQQDVHGVHDVGGVQGVVIRHLKQRKET